MSTALPRGDSNKIPIGHRGRHTVLSEVCIEIVLLDMDGDLSLVLDKPSSH